MDTGGPSNNTDGGKEANEEQQQRSFEVMKIPYDLKCLLALFNKNVAEDGAHSSITHRTVTLELVGHLQHRDRCYW